MDRFDHETISLFVVEAVPSIDLVVAVVADALLVLVEREDPPLLLASQTPSPSNEEDVMEEDGRSRFHERMEYKSWVVRFSSSSS